ncbi:TrkA-C domain protein [Pyrobaculum islandicum DSM 4184]|uniref:TrkA-C domain protein n=1 Tax=Pyrobaculum islandicum (strain DSM 4184 / JCM 9189 / GEO3) TaxID=384616 RepID=A1RSX6_PYRIL|nr:TrkA C-terminal domain-containing protein [Pyrobaculum islandicum]ABL88058.1 TrkA-C domain protein [Pyrobaculum islandicum DSM 4184]
MVKEALILDSNDDLGPQLARVLVENGYIVRVLATPERGKAYEREPVYIHNLTENYEKIIRELDFSRVEIAIFPSPNDMFNLTFAKVAKSQGVPIVVITTRSDAIATTAEEEGIIAIVTYHCVLSRLFRLLNLKFVRLLQIRGDVAMLEILVTSDSKLLGKTIGEIEEDTGAKVAVIRDGEFVVAKDAEIQEGDYLIAIGPRAYLQELTE